MKTLWVIIVYYVPMTSALYSTWLLLVRKSLLV
jgi:hypothetical protein